MKREDDKSSDSNSRMDETKKRDTKADPEKMPGLQLFSGGEDDDSGIGKSLVASGKRVDDSVEKKIKNVDDTVDSKAKKVLGRVDGKKKGDYLDEKKKNKKRKKASKTHGPTIDKSIPYPSDEDLNAMDGFTGGTVFSSTITDITSRPGAHYVGSEGALRMLSDTPTTTANANDNNNSDDLANHEEARSIMINAEAVNEDDIMQQAEENVISRAVKAEAVVHQNKHWKVGLLVGLSVLVALILGLSVGIPSRRSGSTNNADSSSSSKVNEQERVLMELSHVDDENLDFLTATVVVSKIPGYIYDGLKRTFACATASYQEEQDSN